MEPCGSSGNEPSSDLWPQGCSSCDSAERPDTPPAWRRVLLLGPVNHTMNLKLMEDENQTKHDLDLLIIYTREQEWRLNIRSNVKLCLNMDYVRYETACCDFLLIFCTSIFWTYVIITGKYVSHNLFKMKISPYSK